MALFLQQKDGRSDLQERVAAEMKERLQRPVNTESIDAEPALLEDSNKTRPAGVALIVLVTLLVITGIVWASLQA